jgi:hypothetical protein
MDFGRAAHSNRLRFCRRFDHERRVINAPVVHDAKVDSPMLDLAKNLSQAPFWMIGGALVLYLAQHLFEGRLKSGFARIEQLEETSLSLKSDLRSREQDALIEFRLAVEAWEYFLQHGITDMSMEMDLGTFEPSDFYKLDVATFGDVRKAVVKASVLLRSRDLEGELLQTITAVRGLYYPLVQTAMSQIITIQGDLAPYLTRMKLFEASALTDLSVALTPAEATKVADLRTDMTATLAQYCIALVDTYKPIAEQLYALKEKINVHVYRALDSHKIDQPVAGLARQTRRAA